MLRFRFLRVFARRGDHSLTLASACGPDLPDLRSQAEKPGKNATRRGAI
jgi:hypothetical protein